MTRTSRRRLLAGTLGSSLMAQVDAPPEVRLPRKIRLALAGFDGHPEEILRVLPQLPDVELVAVAAEESDPGAQAGALKDRYAAKARRYQTLAQLLAAEQPDVVAVCNHNGRRTAAILACAARQIDVIAEKPLGVSGSHAGAILAGDRQGQRGHPGRAHSGRTAPVRGDSGRAPIRAATVSGCFADARVLNSFGDFVAWSRNPLPTHPRR